MPARNRCWQRRPLCNKVVALVDEELQLAQPVGFIDSVVRDFQGNPEPVASGISAATLHSEPNNVHGGRCVDTESRARRQRGQR